MEKVANPGDHIRRRVAEKRKVSRAQEGIGKLFLLVGGLIFLSLLAMSTRFLDGVVSAPAILKLTVLVLIVMLIILWRARKVVHDGDMPIAAALVWTSALVGGLTLLMLMTGIFEWIDELRRLPRLASAGLTTFLVVFSIAYIIGIASLASISTKLRTYQMHSLNMGPLNRAMYYWGIIFAIQVLMVIVF